MTPCLFREEDSNPYQRDQNPLSCQLNDLGKSGKASRQSQASGGFVFHFGTDAGSVTSLMGSLIKKRRKRMRKKKHKKMLRRTRHQRCK